ncbi:hypothetical protein BLA29_010850, partial [Euroglyphus maynei]
MITWKNTRFYWFGTFRYKFTEHLINHYRENVPKHLMNSGTTMRDFDKIDRKLHKRYQFGF